MDTDFLTRSSSLSAQARYHNSVKAIPLIQTTPHRFAALAARLRARFASFLATLRACAQHRGCFSQSCRVRAYENATHLARSSGSLFGLYGREMLFHLSTPKEPAVHDGMAMVDARSRTSCGHRRRNVRDMRRHVTGGTCTHAHGHTYKHKRASALNFTHHQDHSKIRHTHRVLVIVRRDTAYT